MSTAFHQPVEKTAGLDLTSSAGVAQLLRIVRQEVGYVANDPDAPRELRGEERRYARVRAHAVLERYGRPPHATLGRTDDALYSLAVLRALLEGMLYEQVKRLTAKSQKSGKRHRRRTGK